MNKPTEKKAKYNDDVIDRLKQKYGVSKRFITMSLNKDRHSETSDTIRKEYPKMVKAVKDFIKTL